MEAKDKEGNELMDTEMEDIKKEKKKKHLLSGKHCVRDWGR